MNHPCWQRAAAPCRLVVAALLAAAQAGCSTLELPPEVPLLGIEARPQPPSRMTDLWSYVVLRQPGETSVRGFGGRIMFYGRTSHRPVRVEGTLTVFAFDADEDDPDNVIPEKKYIFTPEQFARYYSRSDLGHSYSVWLPWDEVGGPPRNLSLIARFESATGETVFGQPSSQKLPGFGSKSKQPPEPQASDRTEAGGDEDQPSPAAETEPAAARTDSIVLPPQFSRQLLGTAAPARSASDGGKDKEPAGLRSGDTPPPDTQTKELPSDPDAAAEEEPADAPPPDPDAAAEEEPTDSPRPESPAHSVLERFRAQTGPDAPRGRVPTQKPLHPAASPSAPPATPRLPN